MIAEVGQSIGEVKRSDASLIPWPTTMYYLVQTGLLACQSVKVLRWHAQVIGLEQSGTVLEVWVVARYLS